MAQTPEPAARSCLQNQTPVANVSRLEAAFQLQDAAKEYSEAKRKHHKNTEAKSLWVKRLESIKAEKPSLWEMVQEVGAKFTKRITVTAFIEREERKAKAITAIAKCDTANKVLKAIINDPVKQAQHAEYNANPIHRDLIQAAMAESPDARRKPTPDTPEQVKAYTPSSIELETALAPP